MGTVTFSALDVALRLQEMATTEQQHLGAQRMQWLLFLAQMTFAERYQGACLMPAYFVTTQEGPNEPNVRRCFAAGNPLIGRAQVSSHVNVFLEELFARHHETILEKLHQALLDNPVYAALAQRGEGTEISFSALRQISRAEFGASLEEADSPSIPSIPAAHRQSTKRDTQRTASTNRTQRTAAVRQKLAAQAEQADQSRFVRSNTLSPRSLHNAQQAAKELMRSSQHQKTANTVPPTQHAAQSVAQQKTQQRIQQTIQASSPPGANSRTSTSVERFADGRVVRPWQPRVSSADKHFRIETIKRKT